MPKQREYSTVDPRGKIPPTEYIEDVRASFKWKEPSPPAWREEGGGPTTKECFQAHENLPKKFNNPDWFHGYGGVAQHPMYTTTNHDYGLYRPTVHTMPLLFVPMNQKFSNYLAAAGMYRNRSLNTKVDKSRVIDL